MVSEPHFGFQATDYRGAMFFVEALAIVSHPATCQTGKGFAAS
jgi:hypothetical protein